MPTLNWIGKEAVEKHHLEIPYRLLEYDDELSAGDKEAGNLLIQGDNLHALKALLPYYAGKVKCIYIDPPYNTGNESWIYNDNVNSPEIKQWINQVVGSEEEDLTRHDKWLCMMYPRLSLLKNFLTNDGFICVQIDDNESENLKLILDSIFLPANYVVTLYIKVRYEKKTLKSDMVFHKQIEQILVYRKSKKAEPNLFGQDYSFDKFNYYIKEKGAGRETNLGNKKVIIFNQDEYEITKGDPTKDGLKEIWASGSILDGNSSGRFFRDYLSGRVSDDGLNVLYKVYDIGDDKFDYRYFTGPKKNNATRGKYYQGVPKELLLDDANIDTKQPILNYYDMAAEFGNCRHEGGVEFKSGKKPEKLISMLLEHFSNEGDIILDSFAGSGTTASVAQKMKRQWITIEMGNHCFSHTIPRLTNVINGNDKTGVSLKYNWQGGSGFRFCKLSEPLFDQYGNVREGVTFKQLAYHIFFSETGVPLKENAKLDTPLIGKYKGVAYYLLFNGILGDKTVNGGNVLTSKVLESLPKYKGDKIIFGMANRLSTARLKKGNIVFKQIPVEIKTS